MSLARLEHNASQLKVVFDVLKDLLTDANLLFTPTHLSVVSLDPEKVVAVGLHLDQLYSYRCNSDKTLYFGINIPNLYKLIRGVNAEHIICMEIDEATPNVLKITISHLTKGIISVTSLYALDLPKEEVRFPELTFEATAQMPTTDFLRTIKDLSYGSKKITLSASQDEPRHLTFATQGDTYLYTTSISICPFDEGLTWKSFDIDKVQGQYLIKYIEKFAKPQLSKWIELSMNKDGMLHLHYSIMPTGQLGITVAPILPDLEE